MNVTPDDLLRGMWFAFQSAGEGLQAAADLFEHGHYARSAALAMAARDEFGKARLLRDLWKRADAGGTVTLDEVTSICGKGAKPVKHIQKQHAAQASVTLRGGPGDPLKTVMDRQMRAARAFALLREQGVPADDPRQVAAHAEWDAARKEIRPFVEAAKLRAPGERHELRNRGLYVDVIDDAGKVCWRRPNEITHDEATEALMDAVNDYSLMVRNLEAPINAMPDADGSPSFAAALAAWTDKPTLPEAPFEWFHTAG